MMDEPMNDPIQEAQESLDEPTPLTPPAAEPILTLVEEPADKPLTVSELARQLDKEPYYMNRSAILRFETDPDVLQILGKRGDAYPPEALELWQKIALARKSKPPLVKPETTAHFLRDILNDPIKRARVEAHVSDGRTTDNGDASGALTLPGASQEAMMALIENVMERASERGAERGVAAGIKQAAAHFLPSRNDRVLTLKEAHAETGLSDSTIKRLPSVQETGKGGRRKWKWSVLQDAIDAL